MENGLKPKGYEFGEFRIDYARRRLLREGDNAVQLTPKAFELLLTLIENRGRLMPKEELMRKIWGDSFVEESNLTQTISVLRKTLGERRNENRYIVTEPGRGYRFVAEVTEKFENEVEDEAAEEIEETDVEDEQEILRSHTNAQTEAQPPVTEVKKSYFRNPLAIAVLVCIALVGISIAVYLLTNSATSKNAPTDIKEIKTIAILPFKTIGTNEENQYIGPGMTEALIIKLSNVRQIVVRQSTAVMQYANASPDPTNIGNQLKVDALLDGSVQKDGDRIRVNLRLVRVSDGAPLWAENFDDKYTNLFEVQDSISEQVVRALTLKLTGEEQALIKKRYTKNTEAELLYIKGRYFWNKRTRENLKKSIEYYEQAIAKDPEYALAYTGLADCYLLMAEYEAVSTPREAFTKAREAATKALQIDEKLAEAHTSLAYTLAFYDWDWANAEKEFKRAIELNPNYATAYQWYGEYLVIFGRFDEARKVLERAAQLEPTSLIINTGLASYYFTAGQFDQSIAQSKKVIEMDQNFAYGYVFLWFSYEQRGMEKDAVEALAKTMTLFGEVPQAEEVKEIYAKSGIKAMWRKRLEQINAYEKPLSDVAWPKVIVYARLNDEDKTLEWLNKAYERRERWILNIKYDAEFNFIRDDPRFLDLINRLKL